MTKKEIDQIIDQFAQERYKEGLMKGIELVDKIIDWLDPVAYSTVIGLEDVAAWAKKARDEFKRIHDIEEK